jgi:MFS family permease
VRGGEPPTAAGAGYLELIRRNHNLRRIWLGDVASLLGDWFNTIALYTLVDRLTGSPLALSGVFVTKMLSFALASPVAGLLADRLNRRRLMIACDLVRAILVLGFLLIDDAADVPLLYVLTALQLAVGAAFLPARNASIPNVTTKAELLTANALLSATWSSLLAVGAALGGVAAAWLGLKAVFLIDSATYLTSAFFMVRTVIPQETDATRSGPTRPGALVGEAVRGVLSGWRYLLAHPQVGRIALVKTAWSVAGSALVYMLALLGKHLLPGAPSVGIGYLYAARGIGTGVGPVAARALVPARSRWPVMFGLGICWSALVYLAVGGLAWTYWILPLVLVAHTTSGANWTFSTVLLQERTPDRYRGRVFSTDLLLLTLVDAVAILIAGLLLEGGTLSLRAGIVLFAAVQLLCGVLWLALAVPREAAWRRSQEADPQSEPSGVR